MWHPPRRLISIPAIVLVLDLKRDVHRNDFYRSYLTEKIKCVSYKTRTRGPLLVDLQLSEELCASSTLLDIIYIVLRLASIFFFPNDF